MLHRYNCTGNYRTGKVLVPAARYQLVQYEAPTQAVRAVRGRVLEPSVLVETLDVFGKPNSHISFEATVISLSSLHPR